MRVPRAASRTECATSCDMICIDDADNQQMFQAPLTISANTTSSSSQEVQGCRRMMGNLISSCDERNSPTIICEIYGASVHREEHADHIAVHKFHNNIFDEDSFFQRMADGQNERWQNILELMKDYARDFLDKHYMSAVRNAS